MHSIIQYGCADTTEMHLSTFMDEKANDRNSDERRGKRGGRGRGGLPM